MRSWSALVLASVCISTASCGSHASNHPTAADSSVSPDELAVYETVLTSWLGSENRRQLVSYELSAPPSKQDSEFTDCAKGMNFPAANDGSLGAKTLTGVHFKNPRIELIDGSKWKPADPAEAMANGDSVDVAVRKGFSQSLMSLSQIAFSRDGKDAFVKIGMSCGSLCGSGSTVHLQKSAAGWTILGRCGEWIS